MSKNTARDTTRPVLQDVIAIARRTGAAFDLAAACYVAAVRRSDHESADRARHMCETLGEVCEILPTTPETTTVPLATPVDDGHPLWSVIDAIETDLESVWDRAAAEQADGIRDLAGDALSAIAC